jgi:hypothetical protein
MCVDTENKKADQCFGLEECIKGNRRSKEEQVSLLALLGNRGIPHDLEGEGKCLNKWQSAFRRKGDVMVQAWKDNRIV